MQSKNFANFSSFLELDVKHQQPKGWAFKRFKSLLNDLEEQSDFLYLAHDSHAATIAELRQQGRIYQSTQNLVLLSASGVAKFEQGLS